MFPSEQLTDGPFSEPPKLPHPSHCPRLWRAGGPGGGLGTPHSRIAIPAFVAPVAVAGGAVIGCVDPDDAKWGTEERVPRYVLGEAGLRKKRGTESKKQAPFLLCEQGIIKSSPF